VNLYDLAVLSHNVEDDSDSDLASDDEDDNHSVHTPEDEDDSHSIHAPEDEVDEDENHSVHAPDNENDNHSDNEDDNHSDDEDGNHSDLASDDEEDDNRDQASQERNCYLKSLLGAMGRQHHLRHMELSTDLIMDFPDIFLDAFLHCSHLEYLCIHMEIKEVPIPEKVPLSTASRMALALINEHPKLNTILFGQWRDQEYWRPRNKGIHAIDIDRAEDKAFEIFEREMKKKEYPRIVPPRRKLGYPPSFIENFFALSSFSNMHSLALPYTEYRTIKTWKENLLASSMP